MPSIVKVIGIEVTDKIQVSTGQQTLLSVTQLRSPLLINKEANQGIQPVTNLLWFVVVLEEAKLPLLVIEATNRRIPLVNETTVLQREDLPPISEVYGPRKLYTINRQSLVRVYRHHL